MFFRRCQPREYAIAAGAAGKRPFLALYTNIPELSSLTDLHGPLANSCKIGILIVYYSDYYKVAKKFNVNNTEFYADLAEAFLRDKDAADDKLMRYYEYVVD